MRIYPNPTSSIFTIEISNGLIGKEYIISDNLGRVVKKSYFTCSQERVELISIFRGTYFIEVKGSGIKQVVVIQ
jgi:hypothetical protein